MSYPKVNTNLQLGVTPTPIKLTYPPITLSFFRLFHIDISRKSIAWEKIVQE
jgi:hypothetical protein